MTTIICEIKSLYFSRSLHLIKLKVITNYWHRVQWNILFSNFTFLTPWSVSHSFTLVKPYLWYNWVAGTFPNPVSTYLYINNNSFAGLNYKIYTPSGQLIQQDHLTQINNRLNLSHLAEGIYFIYLNDSFTNNSTVKQLIVKK